MVIRFILALVLIQLIFPAKDAVKSQTSPQDKYFILFEEVGILE